jgi:hypothetical protein
MTSRRCFVLRFLVVVFLVLATSSSFAQTFFYAVNRKAAPFRFPGRTEAQTAELFSQAFAEFNRHSKLQIKPWSGKGPYHIVFAFSPKVAMNALATAEVKNGKAFITVNSVRAVNDKAARSVVLHEVFHQPLQFKANPAADKWGHHPHQNCVFNINASSDKLCPDEIAWLRRRYGTK